MTRRYSPDQAGNVLVLSLLILSILAAVVVPGSVVVIRSLQGNRFATDALQASYLAESGAENGLYRLRVEQTVDLAAFALDDTLPEGQVNRTLSGEPTVTLPAIAQDATSGVAFVVPAGTSARMVRLTGTQGASGLLVSVRIASWPLAETPPATGGETVQEYVVTGAEVNSGIQLTLAPPSGSGATMYRVLLRPLWAAAEPITVSVVDSGGAVVTSAALEYRLQTSGTAGTSQRSVTVTSPAVAPAYGLFTYTLFSEEAITK